MRRALPNAFFFGLTGTPINHLDHNTFATFGATEDDAGYMNKYSFSDSIRDGATLPLNFETVPVELHVDQDTIDREFAELTSDITDEQRDDLARDTAAAVKKANAETPPVSSEDKGKAALTELFKNIKNANTPVIIERIVTEIDDIVKIVRFPGWQDTKRNEDGI